MNPEDIAKRLEDEAEQLALEQVEGPKVVEEISSEIKIIAQALAYREAQPSDLPEIMSLLSSAYKAEIEGPEAFRIEPPINVEIFIQLFEDRNYKWVICEAPNGRGVERDGVILGASVFSVDGISRCNGQIEGNLGSIRLFAILPRFHGLFIGMRLLQKTEQHMLRAGCVRSMACTSTARKSVATWLSRRGYRLVGTSPYPANTMGHIVLKRFRLETASETEVASNADAQRELLQLMQFLKKIESSEATSPLVADAKSPPAPHTVLRLVGQPSPATTIESAFNEDTDEERRKRLGLPYVEGKMHLPPHWRHPPAVSPTVDNELTEVDADDIPLD